MSSAFAATRVLTALAATVFSFTVYAQALPEGWFAAGGAPKEYKMIRAADARYKGEYGASILHESGTGQGFGTLMQAIQAGQFRGKRFSLKGWLKTQNADSVQMWLRIDGTDRMISMDNMDDRPVKGTTPWTEYEIVMDVPESANHLAYGVFVAGKGSVAIDDVQLGIVSLNTRLTTFYDYSKKAPEGTFSPMKRVLDGPVNLSFEK
jgi:hypothetical protein